MSITYREAFDQLRFAASMAGNQQGSPPGIQTAKTLRLAIYHGLTGLFDTTSGQDDSKPYLGQFRQVHQQRLLKHRLLATTTRQIFNRLDLAGIEHAFIKGPCIEHHFYPPTLGLRHSVDIDLLVRPGDVAQSLEILGHAGYQLAPAIPVGALEKMLGQHWRLYRPRQVNLQPATSRQFPIDLHWALSPDFVLDIPTERLLASKQMTTQDAEGIPVISFEDQFLHSVMHGYNDYFFVLKHLFDIHLATRQPAYKNEAISRRARALGVEQHLAEVLATAAFLFETPLADLNRPPNGYAGAMLKHYQSANFQPGRRYPEGQSWTARDRWQYFAHQVRNRNGNAKWFDPALARLGYDEDMLQNWPHERATAVAWYPVAISRRFALWVSKNLLE